MNNAGMNLADIAARGAYIRPGGADSRLGNTEDARVNRATRDAGDTVQCGDRQQCSHEHDRELS